MNGKNPPKLLRETFPWPQRGIHYCMTIIYSNNVGKAKASDIKRRVKRQSVMIADGHFNLPQGFMQVCMSLHTHPRGKF